MKLDITKISQQVGVTFFVDEDKVAYVPEVLEVDGGKVLILTHDEYEFVHYLDVDEVKMNPDGTITLYGEDGYGQETNIVGNFYNKMLWNK